MEMGGVIRLGGMPQIISRDRRRTRNPYSWTAHRSCCETRRNHTAKSKVHCGIIWDVLGYLNYPIFS